MISQQILSKIVPNSNSTADSFETIISIFCNQGFEKKKDLHNAEMVKKTVERLFVY